MFNVTGSAGSSRQTGLLKIISICTIDLKDNLLVCFFFSDLKLYLLHSAHSDTEAQRAQTGLAVLPRNEAILVYHNDTPDSYPSCGNIKVPKCENIKHCKGVRAW